MPEPTPDQTLHLPSLVIKNFRGIDELTIPRLGRVTLLAGKNGVGKTTALDAARIWAARGRPRTLSDVLFSRDEIVSLVGDDGEEITAPDWDALFFARRMYAGETLSIGPLHDGDALQIRAVPMSEDLIEQLSLLPPSAFGDEEMLGFEINFQGSRHTIPVRYLEHGAWPRNRFSIPSRARRSLDNRYMPPEALCNTMGPDVPDNVTLERHFNEVALTPHESKAIDALNLATTVSVERVAIVGSDTRSGLRPRRRILVKVKGNDAPLPLRSLGDGAVRTFSVALALAASSNGFLVIDEAENGIHHSVQTSFWEMVLQTAERNNVQVLATTHSWDGVVGFAQAANDLKNVGGVLYRIQRNGERLRAVEYPETDLANAAKHRIEVR
jgi:ABC-type cobalamin/Fe3+-siderophores transport system ATPase subunit